MKARLAASSVLALLNNWEVGQAAIYHRQLVSRATLAYPQYVDEKDGKKNFHTFHSLRK